MATSIKKGREKGIDRHRRLEEVGGIADDRSVGWVVGMGRRDERELPSRPANPDDGGQPSAAEKPVGRERD
ncbi:hypothetical protein Q1695_008112 [Nippostrongylus brasiliensis]|nr:hypothetical protein Q1695_008112 [Nippostrongylus brasiliensis]